MCNYCRKLAHETVNQFTRTCMVHLPCRFYGISPEPRVEIIPFSHFIGSMESPQNREPKTVRSPDPTFRWNQYVTSRNNSGRTKREDDLLKKRNKYCPSQTGMLEGS